MTAVKDFIVAIELGSSKITGIAGKKNSDGSIQILAYAREEASGFIRKGIIYNIDKTALGLTSIVNKLEEQLDARIAKVYVGIGGQSLHTRKNTLVREFVQETTVNKEVIEQMLEENRLTPYPDLDILDVVPQEYRLNNKPQTDPVGVIATKLEGNYLNIVARSSVKRNLTACFGQAGIEIAGFFVSPLMLADSVLTDIEKRSGCALVDFGADTTTVAVYKNNLLRHLAVIPLGSYNITKDICSWQIEESEAEQLKIKYGSAYTTAGENNDEDKFPINDSRSIFSKDLNKTVEARTTEIILNVKNQVTLSPYRSFNELPCGLVITGGGANLRNLTDAFSDKINNGDSLVDRRVKMRIANFVLFPIKSTNSELLMKNGRHNTLFSLLTAGKENCCLIEKAEQQGTIDFFKQQEEEERERQAAAERAAREAAAAEEARQAEEEERRRKDEENAQAKANAAAAAEIEKAADTITLAVAKIAESFKAVQKAQKMEDKKVAKKPANDANVASIAAWQKAQEAQAEAQEAYTQLNGDAFIAEADQLIADINHKMEEARSLKEQTSAIAEEVRKGPSIFDIWRKKLDTTFKDILED